ncbi:hypothetical protein LINPERPRIM_LOCUS4989, partial [Linum perenne]
TKAIILCCGTNSTEYLGFLSRYLVDFKDSSAVLKVRIRGAGSIVLGVESIPS